MNARLLVFILAAVTMLAPGRWLPTAEPAEGTVRTGPVSDLETIQNRLDLIEQNIRAIRSYIGMPGDVSRPNTAPGSLPSILPTRSLAERLNEVEAQIQRIRPTAQPPAALEGRLVVENQSGAGQWLTINKRVHLVLPGRTDMWVPLSEVVAHLTYFELPKLLSRDHWRWTGRDYEMVMRVRP